MNHEAILAVIERGIDVAREKGTTIEAKDADAFMAWVVLQELRRAGWSIERTQD